MNFEQFQNQSRLYVIGALDPEELEEFEQARKKFGKKAEDFISKNIKEGVMKATATDEQKEKVKGKEEAIIKGVTDRSQKFKAPEPIQPKTHQWTTPRALGREFYKRREETIRMAKSTPDAELRSHVADSPVGAPLDAYQFLELIAAHSKRHTLQIEEVKADPGYPKK